MGLCIMGRKINIELPKYRLQLDVKAKLVKRRKPLLEEPIVPKASLLKRKYRTGSFPAKIVRYLVDHKNIKKIFAANFAFITISTIFIPHSENIQAQGSENVIIESQTNLTTQKSMTYPVEKIVINQGYGVFHKAIDFGGSTDTNIYSIASGMVAYAGWDRSGYGNLVIVQHKNGIESYYAHLSKISVATGQSVATNTILGQMGATGRATGIHLHLEVYQNGVSLNPMTVLSK